MKIINVYYNNEFEFIKEETVNDLDKLQIGIITDGFKLIINRKHIYGKVYIWKQLL